MVTPEMSRWAFPRSFRPSNRRKRWIAHVMAFTKLEPTLSYLGATVLLLFSRVTKLSTASATRAPCGQSP